MGMLSAVTATILMAITAAPVPASRFPGDEGYRLQRVRRTKAVTAIRRRLIMTADVSIFPDADTVVTVTDVMATTKGDPLFQRRQQAGSEERVVPTNQHCEVRAVFTRPGSKPQTFVGVAITIEDAAEGVADQVREALKQK
jgi:hypothetical protein